MKTDFLFTTWNCQDCAKLKMKIKEDAIYEDDFVGNNEQNLAVVNCFSNAASKSLLEKFEFPEEAVTPVLCTFDKSLFWNDKDIEDYLRKQGFLND